MRTCDAAQLGGVLGEAAGEESRGSTVRQERRDQQNVASRLPQRHHSLLQVGGESTRGRTVAAEIVRPHEDRHEIRAKLEPQGVQFGGPQTPEAFGAFIRAENAKYAKLVKDLNVRAE